MQATLCLKELALAKVYYHAGIGNKKSQSATAYSIKTL